MSDPLSEEAAALRKVCDEAARYFGIGATSDWILGRLQPIVRRLEAPMRGWYDPPEHEDEVVEEIHNAMREHAPSSE